MKEYGLNQGIWVLVAAALIGFVVLGTRFMQTQHRLNAVEIALSRAKDDAARTHAEAAKLAKATKDLSTKLKESSATHYELKGRLARANAAIAELSNKLDIAQSNFQKKQSQLQRMTAQLRDTKHALDRLSAEAVESENEITKLRQGIASCEEFFHEWENGGTPPSISTIAALGREAAAAKDCIRKGKISTACRHWQGLLEVIEKLGPPVNESRIEIEHLMSQNKCEVEGYSSSD